MPDFVAYYGSPSSPPESIALKAGPISLIFQNGMIRSLVYREIEFLKRIYFALRDRFWNTIPGIIEDLIIDNGDDSFRITFTSKHIHSDVQYSWKAEIIGSSDGKIEFSMDGKAESTFERNRIGFCALHPIDLCAGRDYKVTHIDGQCQSTTFPLFINPAQPAKDIRELEYNVKDTASVKIIFEGDIFEMEDQRNWTDHSFKTYCTPASEPIPVTIEKDTVIKQKITFLMRNASLHEAVDKKPVSIQLQNNPVLFKTVPPIGVMFSNGIVSPLVVEKVNALALSYIRFDLSLSSTSVIYESEKISTICRQLNNYAELALHFSTDLANEIELLNSILFTSQIPVYRFLIFKDDEKVTKAETLTNVIPVLKRYSSTALIASGTDSYFVELNRNHPASDLLEQVCFSANPQVHQFDSVSVMENVAGIAETLRTAPLFSGTAQMIVSPVTLRPRKNPSIPEKSGGHDDRQKGLFCSAWTSAHLMYSLMGGVAGITYYELAGDSGVMSEDGDEVYPVYHIIASIGEMAGATAGSCICSDPKSISSIMFIKGIQMMLQIANLTDERQTVVIQDLPQAVYAKTLDESTFYEATKFPEQWRCSKGNYLSAEAHGNTFELLPYAVLQIEAAVVR